MAPILWGTTKAEADGDTTDGHASNDSTTDVDTTDNDTTDNDTADRGDVARHPARLLKIDSISKAGN